MFQMSSFKCPSCALAYTTREQRGNRLPRILKCGHTCCEACIRSRASSNHVCECPVCKEQQSFADSSSIQALLLDSYVLGIGAACRPQQVPIRGLKMEPFNLTMTSAIQNKEATGAIPTVICDECGQRPATCRCDTCPSNFCKFCFDQLHKMAKTMRKHQPKSLTAVSTAVETTMCEVHKRLLEFFCTTDEKLICTFCVVMGEHKQHEVVSVLDQNKKSISELKPALDEAMKPYLAMKRTVKKLETVCKSSDDHYKKLVQDIQSEFQHLHCLLQLRSNQLLTELKKANEQCLHGMQEQLKDLTSKMQEFKALQKEVNSAVATNTHQNATHLVERLKSFSNISCFLLGDLEDDKLDLKVTYDSSLKELLKSHGDVQFTPPEKLSLVSVKDLPEGYGEDDQDDTDAESESSSEKQSLDEQSPAPSSISGDDLPRLAPVAEPFNNKRVMVSHIRDPGNFYVQLCSLAVKLQRMQNEINTYCMTQDSRLRTEEEVKVGGLYLAQFHMDNNWYRCRVQRVLSSDMCLVDGTSFRQSTANVEVFYVDYGNSEVVPLTRLRRMSPRFERLGHLAIRCCLYNVMPKSDGRWKKENNALFGKLTMNRKLILREVQRQPDLLFVDLLDDSEGGCGDVRTSVTDALVFLDAAAYHLPGGSKSEKSQASTRRQFYSPTDLCAGQIVNVIVSCIHHPHKMFVQELGSTVEGMQKMLGELQHFCNVESTELDILFSPEVGMVCLAKFPHDHLWYRGRVVSLHGKSHVDVFYVDYGNQERVPIMWVRRIPDKYMHLPIQAIPVTLADLAPVSDSWSDEATTRLSKLTLSKHLLMKVHANSEEFQRAKVSLYVPGKEDTDLCVNAVLVKENLAASTGPLSLVEDVPTLKAHMIVRPKHSIVQAYEESKVESRRQKRLAATMPGLAPPPVDLVHRLQQHAPQLRAEMRPELRPELHREIRAPSRRPATALMAALQMHMAEPPKEPDADERPKEDYVPVHVTYPKSPAHFYVRLLEERKSFKALSSRLQSACDGGRETKDDWEVGQWCAAMGSSYHWMRAKVVEVEEEELHVFFVDSGMQVVMPKAEVVVLPAALAQPPPFARVCHLANMIPAGGSKSWSKTAEECFAEQLSRGNKTFMVQLGEELDDSLPVDVMVEEVIEAGALEPMRKEYRSVREALKEMGYGFISKKSSSKTESAAESAEATRSSIVKTTGDREAAPSSSKVQTASDREAAPSSKVDAMGDRETASSSKVKIVSDAEITPSREVKTTGDGSPDALKEPVVSKNVTENSASSQSEEPGPARADSAPDKVSHPEEVVSAAPSVSGKEVSTVPSTEVEEASPTASTNVEEECTKPASKVEESDTEQDDAVISKGCNNVAVGSPASNGTEAVAAQLDGAADEAAHSEKNEYKDAVEDGSITNSSSSECLSDDILDNTDFLVIQDDQPLFKWRPRPFPKEKQLMVMPSHIDEDAVIYVQIIEKEELERYKVMKETMNKAYCDRSKPQHRTLRIGQACIARFSLDKMYYRAVILNSGEKGIEVRFVDYGTSEYVSPDGIFTDLMFEDVPILCLEVEFYGLKPFSSTGSWPLKVLDTLHYMVVEQNCSMVVKARPTKTSRAKVHLFLPDGVSLYEFMLEAGLACKTIEELPAEIDEVTDLIPCPYKTLEFPEDGVFPVIVTNLDDADLGCIQLAKFAHPSNDEQEAINCSIDAFSAMAEALQKEAEDCPLLLDTSLGTACIGKYGYDKLWYRGIVTGVKKKKVTVFYVDYGNSESILKEDLRVLPAKFLDIPMQAKACRFHGVTIVGDRSKARLMMSDILFDDKIGCLARIKNKDSDPIEIDLMNSSLELIYQPLADDGCITIEREP
ncbi:RING finger protein 17 isoform X2 [Dermacentor silvarum]|uniref:RING finger protein 17 isoform X2 n=1 Tax=Dermacentor silvarum TaxID=543639 RepID=UPI002100C951|nr:RING finger protein 17 isoform X2 [Dermacentor silvarum]